jgi:hypothetical protein
MTNASSNIVSDLSARYLNEPQSVVCGIKGGWYAMDGKGKLPFGPFSNREKCLTRISQFNSWSMSSHLRHRPT